MVKKPLHLSLVIFSIFIFSACTKTVETDSDGGTTTHENNIVTEKVTYQKDEQEFIIELNKINKRYTIESESGLADDEEYMDLFGEQVTSAPFLINTVCSLFNQALFDPESFNVEKSGEPITADSEYQSIVGDYKPERLKFTFFDKESLESIATCESTQAGFDNIQFEVIRDYSDVGSMFGMEIGKIPEDE